jgi:hypothetical protein
MLKLCSTSNSSSSNSFRPKTTLIRIFSLMHRSNSLIACKTLMGHRLYIYQIKLGLAIHFKGMRISFQGLPLSIHSLSFCSFPNKMHPCSLSMLQQHLSNSK